MRLRSSLFERFLFLIVCIDRYHRSPILSLFSKDRRDQYMNRMNDRDRFDRFTERARKVLSLAVALV